MITEFKHFLLEVRFEDVFKSDNDYINSFKRNFDDSQEFVRFITIRIFNVRTRFEISYNHTESHDLKQRIANRTSLKNILEFNNLLKCAILGFFQNEHEDDGVYSLFFKEYTFSIILNINNKTKKIFIRTASIGMDSANVNEVIEIDCKL
jgi:hypothetical protein